MTELVDASEIEQIVGTERHPTQHRGRAVSRELMVYILHSEQCRDGGVDLRECPFSVALDHGIFADDWDGQEDRPVTLTIGPRRTLVPVPMVLEVGQVRS